MQLINDYKLLHKIGKGSYGEVWKAIQIYKKKHVAIKIEKKSQRNTLKYETTILRYLKDLDNNRNRIEDYEKSIKTINAQEYNSSKETTAEYYMYISWSLVAILVGGITIKTLVKK